MALFAKAQKRLALALYLRAAGTLAVVAVSFARPFTIPCLADERAAHQPSQQKAAENSLSRTELVQAITARQSRVPEFSFIREEAEKLGVRAYLFGGTAAGYAHYVKWDLQREKGDPRFQAERFDYDYTNIFRSTQDLDIVVDGSPEQAKQLQQQLENKFPHFQGNKTAWEVRLLRQSIEGKEALLANPDFLDQHTDSNSTGLIELTRTADDPVVRDLRDWNSKAPYFLRDIHEGKLHYYYSPQHGSTSRFKRGENPPIFSVIRYLTKTFQYELELRPEDLQRIRELVRKFDPRKDLQSAYARSWIEKNGKKLFQHAVNIEYAWNLLDELGLRKKLIDIKGDAATLDSLAWWLQKEPLRTSPIGKGSGKTAAMIAQELGEKELMVAHETNNFLAYESITRAHTGDPNVLISRKGTTGEAAVHGDGFYTQIGRTGARGTGLTVRFQVAPDAREGTDFIREKEYLIFRNKAAIRVIPESLSIAPYEFFKMLLDGEDWDYSDRGILEKLRRRNALRMASLSPEEMSKIHSLVDSALRRNSGVRTFFREWLNYEESRKFPEKLFRLADSGGGASILAEALMSSPVWRDYPWPTDLLRNLLERIIDTAISQEFTTATPVFGRLFEWLKSKPDINSLQQDPAWAGCLEKLEAVEILNDLVSRNAPRELALHRFKTNSLLQRDVRLLEEVIRAFLQAEEKILSQNVREEFRRIALNCEAARHLPDFIGARLLASTALSDDLPPGREFAQNTVFWQSRNWAENPREKLLQALELPSMSHRIWSLRLILSAITKKPDLDPGEAWLLLDQVVENNLMNRDSERKLTLDRTTLKIWDPARWDRESLRALEKSTQTAIEKKAGTILRRNLSIPAIRLLPEVAEKAFSALRETPAILTLNIASPLWLNRPEVAEALLQQLERNPHSAKELDIPFQLRLMAPNEATHRLLEKFLQLAGSSRPHPEVRDKPHAWVEARGLDNLAKDGLILSPPYRDLLPEYLAMCQRPQRPNEHPEESLVKFIKEHPESIRASLDDWIGMHQKLSDRSIRKKLESLLSLATEQAIELEIKSGSGETPRTKPTFLNKCRALFGFLPK